MNGDSHPSDDDDFLGGDDDFILGDDDSLLELMLLAKPNIIGIPAASSTVYDMMSEISSFIHSAFGEPGIYAMLCAIEAETGWSLEMVGTKAEIEKALYEQYGFFDDQAWVKARNSPYWDMMIREIYEVSESWQRVLVSTIAENKPPLSVRLKYAWRVLTRRF